MSGYYTVTLTITDTGTGESDSLAKAAFVQAISPTVIHYDYDGLYRLTEAAYTGAISATYQYHYDAVGNMDAYTETITSTTSVERFFNDANQLTTSVDASGTTTYTYDLNGNLTTISPPGSGPVTAYAYDQRNLLTSTTQDSQPLAEYVYDGQGNRLRQVDHTGAQPITTTYTNDIVGLSQVLVADEGTAQVVNLFGLDLIHQDDDSQTLTLLVDGLGSVRSEMAGSEVRSTITYDPYGNLLAQEGSSGTVYGFTGEQEDESTGLLYLRARYYSSELRAFLAKDPWTGIPRSPSSFHGFSYVGANPATLADPTGQDPYWCEGKPEPERTLCYQDVLGVDARDLTRWLYEEMVTNLNDPRLQDVRNTNRAGGVGLALGTSIFTAGCFTANPLLVVAGAAVDIAGGAAYGIGAYQFGELVGDHKPWDFKHRINELLGPGITLCGSTGCEPDIEFSVPGNIHFGFVAREAGYAGVIVNVGAGYAEITDPSHWDPNHPSHSPYVPAGKFDPVIGPYGLSLLSLNFGDDPKDHHAVEFGIYLYDRYGNGRGLTLPAFKQELSRFLPYPYFAEQTPLTGAVPPDIAEDWPYWVGYFQPDPR
jgi:RHS repeat-associated protein